MITNLDEIIKEFKRPFPPDVVHFKVQAGKKPSLIVAYVDARDVAERLNAICPRQWSDSYTPVYATPRDGSLVGIECSITIEYNAYARESEPEESWTVTRSDVGEGDLQNPMGAIKGFYSDAFKRAAVKFGVATSLYDLPTIYEELPENSKGKPYIPKKISDELRDRYTKWVIRQEIVNKFGEVYA